MWRGEVSQAWRARMTAQSSVTLLERRGPIRRQESECPQGDAQAEPAMQKGEPLCRAELSVQRCTGSVLMRQGLTRSMRGGGVVLGEKSGVLTPVPKMVRVG
jgi:hypothetical protein